MPARGGGGGEQHDGPHPACKTGAATLVRSDQDSGMALVKSKDGRTKWLAVSADPSSSSGGVSVTWDERVRTWASMLGVCAAPPPPSPSPSSGTPLPTPPPKGSAWGGDDEATKPPSGFAAPVATTNSSEDKATTSAAAAAGEEGCTTTAAFPAVPTASTARRKPGGTGKRAGVGSFARGFLLGLGGGISGGGGDGGTASKKSPAGRDQEKIAEATKAAAAAAATPAVVPKRAELLAVEGAGDDPMDVLPPSSSPSPGGAEGGDFSGRNRWVKGAPPSPSPSDCSDGSSSSSRSSSGSSEGGHNRGASNKEGKLDVEAGGDSSGSSGRGGGAPSPAVAVAVAAAAAVRPDDDGMDWLETGPGGSKNNNNAGKTNSGGGGGGGGSKKKKKAKAKSKGGGGGKPSKKPSSCPSPSSTSGADMTVPHSSSPEQTGQGQGQDHPAAGAVAAATSTSTSKSKRAKLKKQQKQQQKVKVKKEVAFGLVNLLEFTRDVGGCGVPSDGTWGLALGLPFRETVVDVDGYEASKAEILEERTAELSKKQRHLSTGETRQFDYRPIGEKNPLFARLGEKDRSKKLLEYACFHKADLEEADRDKDATNSGSHRHSHSDGHGHGHGGKSESEFDAYSHKVSHAEFVDKSQAAAVELTALRDSRRENQGCTCSCVRPDKLNLAKLRGELGKRGLKASGSKKELVKVLQQAMREEEEAQNGGKALKTCRSEECQCVRDGVECHADLCNCCKGPSIGEKDAHHGGNCGNPGGVYAYSSSVVRSYRGPFVTSKVAPGRERGHGRSDSICSESH